MKALCGSLHFSHKGSKKLNGTPESSCARQPVGKGSSADLAFSLANQCSTLPSHAITTTQAKIPNDGLLRPPRTPYGLLES